MIFTPRHFRRWGGLVPTQEKKRCMILEKYETLDLYLGGDIPVPSPPSRNQTLAVAIKNHEKIYIRTF